MPNKLQKTYTEKSNTHLCLDEEEALLLRRAPGDRELRELEFEEL